MAFHCLLVSPSSKVFDDDVVQVNVPGSDGDFSLLSGHAPIVAFLRSGTIAIRIAGEECCRFTIRTGLLKLVNNQCLIMVDDANQLNS